MGLVTGEGLGALYPVARPALLPPDAITTPSPAAAAAAADSSSDDTAAGAVAEAVAGAAAGAGAGGRAYVLLTDIVGTEDHYGDMDFKVAGSAHGA